MYIREVLARPFKANAHEVFSKLADFQRGFGDDEAASRTHRTEFILCIALTSGSRFRAIRNDHRHRDPWHRDEKSAAGTFNLESRIKLGGDWHCERCMRSFFPFYDLRWSWDELERFVVDEAGLCTSVSE